MLKDGNQHCIQRSVDCKMYMCKQVMSATVHYMGRGSKGQLKYYIIFWTGEVWT